MFVGHALEHCSLAWQIRLDIECHQCCKLFDGWPTSRSLEPSLLLSLLPDLIQTHVGGMGVR